MKKFLTIFLTAALCLTLLAGCGSSGSSSKTTEDNGEAGAGLIDLEDYLWEVSDDMDDTEYVKMMNRNYKIIKQFQPIFTEDSYDTFNKSYQNYQKDSSRENAEAVIAAIPYLVQAVSIEEGCIYLWEEDNMPMMDGEVVTEEQMDEECKTDGYGFQPFMIKYLAEDPSTAKGNIIFISGGGFSDRSNTGEGYPACELFQSMGYNCFLLQRRVAPYCENDIYLDLQRSIRLVKYYAEQEGWGGQDMIAAGGFSGGGMTIVGMESYAYGSLTPDQLGAGSYVPDDIDAINSDLNVAIVCYGTADSDNSGILVNPNLPAFYITHGQADETVDPANSQNLYDVLTAANIPAQLYMVPDATHGFGPGTASNVAEGCKEWPSQADEFMQAHLGYHTQAE